VCNLENVGAGCMQLTDCQDPRRLQSPEPRCPSLASHKQLKRTTTHSRDDLTGNGPGRNSARSRSNSDDLAWTSFITGLESLALPQSKNGGETHRTAVKHQTGEHGRAVLPHHIYTRFVARPDRGLYCFCFLLADRKGLT
jgi:hypothetical protein